MFSGVSKEISGMKSVNSYSIWIKYDLMNKHIVKYKTVSSKWCKFIRVKMTRPVIKTYIKVAIAT